MLRLSSPADTSREQAGREGRTTIICIGSNFTRYFAYTDTRPQMSREQRFEKELWGGMQPARLPANEVGQAEVDRKLIGHADGLPPVSIVYHD